MKITALRVTSILGLKSAEITLDRPVLAVLGANGDGKSSIAESLRLAMLAEHDRVGYLKELGAYVHSGAKAGSIEIEVKGEKPHHVTITAAGAVTDARKGEEPHPALRYCLRPQSFAELDTKSRREFLYQLLGLDMGYAAIAERLLEKECSEAKVDAIAPMLRAGFDSACKYAMTQTSDARGAWKVTTGENYGAVKAATWRAHCPAFSGDDAAELLGLDKSIASAEAELAEATKRLAIAEHEDGKRKNREAEVSRLREAAKAFAYHEDLVKRAEKDVADIEARLLDAQQKAGHAPLTPATKLRPCPSCGTELCEGMDGKLEIYVAPSPMQHDAEAAAAIPELQKAIALQRTVLNRHIGNRDLADQAAKTLKAIEDIEPTKVEDYVAVRQTVDTLRTSVTTMKTRQSELRKVQADMDAADDKTKKARQFHKDVEEWSAIAAALSPDGIPAEILSEALGPINKRLAQSCLDAKWKKRTEIINGKQAVVYDEVRLHEDMRITYGGRPYSRVPGANSVISESEKWRADTLIAEAISFLSGLRLLVLDRFDVLDNDGRVDALYWLDTLCLEKEISTAIVLGTMDSLPVDLDTIRAVRVGGLGRCSGNGWRHDARIRGRGRRSHHRRIRVALCLAPVSGVGRAARGAGVADE